MTSQRFIKFATLFLLSVEKSSKYFCRMKFSLLITLLFTSSFFPVIGQTALPLEKETITTSKTTENTPQWIKDFSNLPKETRQKYIEYFSVAEQLFQQKRIIECLLVTDEIAKLFIGNPGLDNLRGACYTEHKNYKEAEKCFLKAVGISPDNISMEFNLAEVYFVSKQYEKSRKAFQKIAQILEEKLKDETLPAAQKPDLQIRALVDFKLFLIAIKLKDESTADTLAKKYDIWEDCPFALCVQAVRAFEKNKPVEAERKLQSASSIYGKNQLFTPYRDALAESGWIKISF